MPRVPGDVQAFKKEIEEFGERKKLEQESGETRLQSVSWFFNGLMPCPSEDNPYILLVPERWGEMNVSDALTETFEKMLPGKYTAEELGEVNQLASIAVGAAMERTGKVPAEYEEAIDAAVNWMSRTHDGERG